MSAAPQFVTCGTSWRPLARQRGGRLAPRWPAASEIRSAFPPIHRRSAKRGVHDHWTCTPFAATTGDDSKPSAVTWARARQILASSAARCQPSRIRPRSREHYGNSAGVLPLAAAEDWRGTVPIFVAGRHENGTVPFGPAIDTKNGTGPLAGLGSFLTPSASADCVSSTLPACVNEAGTRCAARRRRTQTR